MATIEAMALRHAKAMERVKNSARKLSGALKIDGLVLPLRGRDKEMSRVLEMEAFALWFESAAAIAKRTQAKAKKVKKSKKPETVPELEIAKLSVSGTGVDLDADTVVMQPVTEPDGE